MNIDDLRNEKVGICVSGGLDSKTVTKKLVDSGVKTIGFSADVGQPDEEDIAAVVRKMEPCGAETVLVDLKEDMARACLAMIRAQARYDGGYWNSTGIARAVTVRSVAQTRSPAVQVVEPPGTNWRASQWTGPRPSR